MKPAVLAFALTSLAATTASAQPRAVRPTVPLVVESTGAAQDVRVTWRGPVVCTTPCTLHVAPGQHTLWTGGRGLRSAEIPLVLDGAGARVRVRAASRGRLVGGIILTSLGGSVLLGAGALSLAVLIDGVADDYNRMYAAITGGIALLVGAPTLIGGALLLRGTDAGVEGVTPASALTRWSFGVAPVRGGALAGATLRF